MSSLPSSCPKRERERGALEVVPRVGEARLPAVRGAADQPGREAAVDLDEVGLVAEGGLDLAQRVEALQAVVVEAAQPGRPARVERVEGALDLQALAPAVAVVGVGEEEADAAPQQVRIGVAHQVRGAVDGADPGQRRPPCRCPGNCCRSARSWCCCARPRGRRRRPPRASRRRGSSPPRPPCRRRAAPGGWRRRRDSRWCAAAAPTPRPARGRRRRPGGTGAGSGSPPAGWCGAGGWRGGRAGCPRPDSSASKMSWATTRTSPMTLPGGISELRPGRQHGRLRRGGRRGEPRGEPEEETGGWLGARRGGEESGSTEAQGQGEAGTDDRRLAGGWRRGSNPCRDSLEDPSESTDHSAGTSRTRPPWPEPCLSLFPRPFVQVVAGAGKSLIPKAPRSARARRGRDKDCEPGMTKIGVVFMRRLT